MLSMAPFPRSHPKNPPSTTIGVEPVGSARRFSRDYGRTRGMDTCRFDPARIRQRANQKHRGRLQKASSNPRDFYPALDASSRQLSSSQEAFYRTLSSFLRFAHAGKHPATSQLDWLSSTRQCCYLCPMLRTSQSFSGGIRALRQFFRSRRWCHLLFRRMPHTICRWRGAVYCERVAESEISAIPVG